jgi:hypothetical protein
MGSIFLGGATPRTNRRTDDELIGDAITIRKTARETLKTNDLKGYQKLQESCVRGLDTKFDFIKPLDSKVTVEQLTQITSTVQKIKTFKKRLISHDMIDVFTIPKRMVRTLLNNEWQPDQTQGTFNLLEEHRTLPSLDSLFKANKYFQEYGASYHVENVQWSGELLLNSCSQALKMKILESTDHLSEAEKGGPTYFGVMIEKVIATSEIAMRGVIKMLESMKLTDYPGEDVNKCASCIRGGVTLLAEHNALPIDHIRLVLSIFSHCSTKGFVTLVQGLKTAITLKWKKHDLEEILRILETDYNERIQSHLEEDTWEAKATKSNQESTFLLNSNFICFNCGGFHLLKDCTLPKDESAIAARKKIILGNRKTDVDGKANSGGSKDDKSDKPTNPKKIPPKTGESHEKEFDGTTLHWCGKCGRWTNHKTADHKSREELANKNEGEKKEEEKASVNLVQEEDPTQGGFIGGATALNFG